MKNLKAIQYLKIIRKFFIVCFISWVIPVLISFCIFYFVENNIIDAILDSILIGGTILSVPFVFLNYLIYRKFLILNDEIKSNSYDVFAWQIK